MPTFEERENLKLCPFLLSKEEPDSSDARCFGKACEWFVQFDKNGAKKNPEGCAVRFIAQDTRAKLYRA